MSGMPSHQRQVSYRNRDLHGNFAMEHTAEMIRLARHQEEIEKAEHPLNRIMSIEEEKQRIVISTTDIHLPRRIGETLRRAFHGEVDTHFEEDGYFVRVDWRPQH